MKIHEYQAKEILEKFKVPVPKGRVVADVADVKAVVDELGLPVVVKAQIHAGGRGKGGGVKVAKTLEAAQEAFKSIHGMNLITHQTSPEGQKVRTVLVEEGMNIAKELYIGIVLDRETDRVCFMASEEGGMEIEEVAAKTPEKIMKEWVDPVLGLMPAQARKLAFFLNLPPEAMRDAVGFLLNLYKAFIAKDCSLAEINPLVLTAENKILALDCKMNFDDNALFRQKDVVEYRDLAEEEELEIEASKYSLNYIKLDGSIGCMVNGAGLAMATMDIIKISGGEPANFLDVGGGASEEQIENAFKIILADSSVKGIFINIFGGILRCDRLANGVVNAARKINVSVPVVIRMEGTNVAEGKKILKESGFNFILADNMRDGAEKAVAAVGAAG
ncbi:MAG: ADP-forming succinate--CoA ligase subunit beta [Nitrospinota bacterium]|nr:ADP-forming succinate--CoA ligase subunit beta [Nitrospinota bacterium]MDH5756283.1 ADP-forming succinate--CoA ligase subunit beta [Nitrospinota bacterium]